MIAMKNVTVGTLLKDVSLAIRPKECVCITSDSASALESLFRVLATLEQPANGTVEVDNVDVSVLPHPVLQLFRSRLGLVFHPKLLIEHLTAGQNIALPLYQRGIAQDTIEKAANDLLKRLNLAAKASSLPKDLTGEERQLTCIARCLIGAPLVIVALEPFHDVSDRNAFEVASLFQNLRKKGATLILLSRDARTAEKMGVTPVTLANGTLHGYVERQPEPTHEPEPVPEPAPSITAPEEDVIQVRAAVQPATPKQQTNGNEPRKIRITSIGSGLS